MIYPANSATSKHVTARFHAAAATYDRQPGVQPAVAKRVADMIDRSGCLEDMASPSILEIGCGSGLLTARLTERFPSARILAVDIAPGMVGYARQRLGDPPQVIWAATDVRHLDAPAHSFSLITSSSALHWVQPLQPALEKLREMLAPNRRLICGLMTRGTLAELRQLRREIAPGKPAPVNLPGKHQVLEAFSGAGFDITAATEDELVARHPSARDFLRTLNRQGVTGGIRDRRQALTRSELHRLADSYDQRCSHPAGGVTATYEMLFLEAVATVPPPKQGTP